jgi:hypothetical protein
MHLLDLLVIVTLGGQMRSNGVVHYHDESDDVAKRDVGRGLHVIRRIFLDAGVSQRDFLLVV